MGFFPVDRTPIHLHAQYRSQRRGQMSSVEGCSGAQNLFGIPRQGRNRLYQKHAQPGSGFHRRLAGRPQTSGTASRCRQCAPPSKQRSRPRLESGFNQKFRGPRKTLRQRHRRRGPGQWRRPHRSDYLVTQHLQPGSHDCSRASGKAVARGLRVKPHIKTSLAPGSRVVTHYLERRGCSGRSRKLGFALAGYGCTTCIGNSGDLAREFNETISKHDLVVAAVLSGNRNFEARIHPNIRRIFLASPPLVVAFAIAGRANIDLENEPLGRARWQAGVPARPGQARTRSPRSCLTRPTSHLPAGSTATDNELWNGIDAPSAMVTNGRPRPILPPSVLWASRWAAVRPSISGARALMLGDSVTTDHISPAGSADSRRQMAHRQGVERKDFNSLRLPSRQSRGDDSRHLRQRAGQESHAPPDSDGSAIEGGFTIHRRQRVSVFDAAMRIPATADPDHGLCG